MLIATILCQFFLLVFHQATILFDFYPFTNLRNYTLKERLPECRVNGTLMALPLAGFFFRIGWMITTALVIYPVLLIGEYFNWWRHSLFGPTAGWQETCARLFEAPSPCGHQSEITRCPACNIQFYIV